MAGTMDRDRWCTICATEVDPLWVASRSRVQWRERDYGWVLQEIFQQAIQDFDKTRYLWPEDSRLLSSILLNIWLVRSKKSIKKVKEKAHRNSAETPKATTFGTFRLRIVPVVAIKQWNQPTSSQKYTYDA